MTYVAAIAIVVLLVLVFVSIYAGLYMPVLRWLGVTEKVGIRSLYLAAITVGIQFGCGLFSLALLDSEFLGNILAAIILAVIFKRLLVIKIWQAIVIPIAVSAVGSVLLAVILMFIFQSTS
jgi:formate/nitrite transporter FocA (FNT family)